MRVVAGSSWLLLCWLGCSVGPSRLGVAEDYGRILPEDKTSGRVTTVNE